MLSVIIPIYNEEKNIEEFPESLKENLEEGINKIKNNLKKVNIQAIFIQLPKTIIILKNLDG